MNRPYVVLGPNRPKERGLMLKKKTEALVTELGEGVTRKLLINGGRLMAVEFHFTKGAEGKLHSHPHEQIGTFLGGRFQATVGELTRVMEKGDSYYVPPNVVHGMKCLEDGIVLDVFTPIRDDFVSPVD